MDESIKKALADRGRTPRAGRCSKRRAQSGRIRYKPGDWARDLQRVINENNSRNCDGNKASSYSTQSKRANVLFAGFRLLRQLGYKIQFARSFKGKHLQVLVNAWRQQGMAPATIQNNISIFRVFAEWIGKPGMIGRSSDYAKDDRSAVTRKGAALKDKSWTSAGVNISEKLLQIYRYDKRIGAACKLAFEFGLRRKECLMIKPHASDREVVLIITAGTKGGRERCVPIDTKSRREALDLAKSVVAEAESMADPNLTLKQSLNRISNLIRKFGITKAALGITLHGLRHEQANLKYQKIAGQSSPVRGGNKPEQQLDLMAREVIAQELGHHRIRITDAYLGRWHPVFDQERESRLSNKTFNTETPLSVCASEGAAPERGHTDLAPGSPHELADEVAEKSKTLK